MSIEYSVLSEKRSSRRKELSGKRQIKSFIASLILLSSLNTPLPAFASIFNNNLDFIVSKDMAISTAFREEAMREAFQEAQIRNMEDAISGGPSILERIHPYVSLNTSYDDNFFLVNSNIDRDVILRVKPGVKLLLGAIETTSRAQVSSQSLKIDTGALFANYMRHKKFNKQKPYASINYNLGRRNHRLELNYYYKASYEPASDLVVNEGKFADYNFNEMQGSWEVVHKKLGLGLDYDVQLKDYRKDFKLNSSEQDVASVTAFYQAFPKTRFFFEYDYGIYEYTKTPIKGNNSTFNTYWLGARGVLSKKTTGILKFGSQQRRYNNKTLNIDGITIQMDVSYDYSPKTKFLLGVSKGPRQGTYLADGNEKSFSYYLSCLYNFNKKFNVTLSPWYFEEDQYSSGRKDDNYRYSFSLNYLFSKWMKFSLTCMHFERRSNQLNAGYKNNTVSLVSEANF